MKSDYLNKWLVYSWSSYSNDPNNDLIHPDDLSTAQQNGLGICECIGVENGYVLLRQQSGLIIRAKKKGIHRLLPNPKFCIADEVMEVTRSEIHGIINSFIWHDKDADYKFYISVNGKKKSRRYNSDELEKSFVI